MTTTTDAFLLGAYEAKTCPEKLRKTLDPAYADVPRDPIPSGDLARMESGRAFEAQVARTWVKLLGRKVAVLSGDRTAASLARREADTLRLMAQGDALVIWNPRLPAEPGAHRAGEPDALLHAGVVGGVVRWMPVDVKDHGMLEGSRSIALVTSTLKRPLYAHAKPTVADGGAPRRDDALQLAHYYRMLQGLGHATEAPVGGIIGREMQVLWHDLDAALYKHEDLGSVSGLAWYDHEFAARVALATDALAELAPADPQWKAECASCVFRTVCRDELRDADHLTLLPGITPTRAKAHLAAGIDTVGQLARLDHRTARLVDADVDVHALRTWALDVPATTPVTAFTRKSTWHAALASEGVHTAADALALHAGTGQYATNVWNLAGSIDQARVTKAGKVHRARGVDQVAFRPVRVEQDFDIEDYNGYVYLIGVRTTTRRRRADGTETTRSVYTPFVTWDGTEDAEADVFARFWAHVTGAQGAAHDAKQGYRAYHYTHHEPATFARLARRHAGMPGVPTVEQVEAWFASSEVVDLYPVLSRDLVWPTESVSLKNIAKWVRFSWRDSDPGGSNSMAWYEQAVGNLDPAERDGYRARLLDYNADDCQAQTAVREWLSRLGEAWAPGAKLPSVTDLDKRFARRR